jgi:class 3 adenylate cyclase
MDADEWAAMIPPQLRRAHFNVSIGCPDPADYPNTPAECTPGAEPLMLISCTLDGSDAKIPPAVLAAMLRRAAEMIERDPPDAVPDLSAALHRAMIAAAGRMHGAN